MWKVEENRQYDTKIKIDGVDYSENLIDLETSFDLDGSSVSSVFGSVLRDEIELEVFDNISGKELDLSFGYYTGDYEDEPQFDYKEFGKFKIYEVDYDEKMNTTKLKAETDLSALDDEFVLQNLPMSDIGEEQFISFKDFEIKDLKPNLIPNSWDSFEPYGSGINYVENWNFESDDLREFSNYSNSMSIRNGVLLVEATADNVASWIRLTNIKYIGEVIVRVKIKAPNGARLSGGSGTDSNSLPIASNDKFEVHELSLTINSDTYNRIYVYTSDKSLGTIGDKIEIDWVQITPADNQHLVVEKTPLGNGLTHIQTWGGSSAVKLLSRVVGINQNENFNMSMYVKNDNKDFFADLNGTTLNWHRIPSGFSGYKNENGKKETAGSHFNFYIRALSKDDNVDFIASDPQIVEGDVPNPTMVVNKLPDGREEVDIYGATDSTELVYKTEAATGEPYELYGSIENKGRELQIDSTLGKSNIKKGDNQLNIKGEAQNREVAIKIGVA